MTSATNFRKLRLGYLMYCSNLLPRRLALLGLIGGPLVSTSGLLVLLGFYEQLSMPAAIATIPEFIWELSFGIWLIVKVFNPSALVSLSTDPDDGVLSGVEQSAVVPSNGHPVPSKDWRHLARTRAGAQSSLGPFPCPYSPACVEGEF